MARRTLALILIVALLPFFASTPAQAQLPTGIVISEIHYHPQSVGDAFPDYDDREDTEFIEIVNLGASTVAVGGWCLADAVDFCFAGGTSLAPQDPFVVARDAAVFEAAYGTAPDGVYGGKLSNSGESVRLIDAALSTVTQVIWQTTNPWPVTPDGDGPSLELVATGGQNTSPANWAASSVLNGTPGTIPSLSGQSPPLVVSHTSPSPAVAGSPIELTATAINTTSMSVIYDVDFGSNTTVAMTQNGNQWSVQLPAIGTGEMLRFRFEATGPGGTTTSPRVDDSITWWATAVPTNPVSSVPTLDVHISNSDWNDIEDLACGCMAVVVHDGRVWTDVEMRRAGYTSINNAKGHYRLDFPDGHPFVASWLVGSSDELTLDMGWPNIGIIREQLSWNFMVDLGFPQIQSQHVRMSRNGSFHGLYLLRDEQDGDWRERNGFDNGAFYKFENGFDSAGWAGGWEKKEALDQSDADLSTFRTCLDQSGTALRTCLLDQADVPQIVHELASMMVIRQTDQREFNWFLWRNDTQGGLWRMLPEDLDRTWGGTAVNPGTDSYRVYERCMGFDNTPGNEVCRGVLSVPEFEDMYNRRIRTLVDEHLADPQWPAEVAATANYITTDWNDDEDRWNRTSASMATISSELQGWISDYAAHLRGGGHDGEVPAQQSATPTVNVVELRADQGDGVTWVLLQNPSGSESVDVSGWEFDGLATITNGAVILPGDTIAVTNDIDAFLLANPSFTGVRAQLQGTVAGETQLLRRDGSLVTSLGDPAPNPLVLNEWNAVSSSNTLAVPDPAFGAVAGNGGDWFELVVVEDQLDIRGWKLVLSDNDGAGPAVRDEFVFTNASELAELESGLIITVSEDRPDDLAYAPVDGDWHINFQANGLDSGQFFTAVSQENFDTNHDDWQLAIYDAAGELVFGPAGEGIGDLTGVNSAEIGELETDPGLGVNRLIDYGDGDGSTYGKPNVTAGAAQDFSAIAWAYRRGDVNCDSNMDVVDALLIAQLAVGNRFAVARCPIPNVISEANPSVGDLNFDARTDIVDALLISQCAVGIRSSGFCPDP